MIEIWVAAAFCVGYVTGMIVITRHVKKSLEKRVNKLIREYDPFRKYGL